tara:strand:- start:857 stop:4372 length:3516 start_codon:yes stop_codon:yes gene_type:complete
MKTPFNVLRHVNQWEMAPRDPATIGAAIINALGGSAAFAATTIAFNVTVAGVVGYLATTAITSWALNALAPDIGGIGGSRGLMVNATDPAAPHDIVYGAVRKGGIRTYVEATGTENKFLHMILVLAGHELEAIDDIYLNDEVVTVNATSGFVTSGDWNSKVRIKKHRGNQTAADSLLLSESNQITANFVGNGIAYLYIRLEYDQDVFANGVPMITAKVRGRKVYDPRTTSTAYSANAALAVRDYITAGFGLADSAVDDLVFAASANVSDETIALEGGGSEPRYEINGVVSSDMSPRTIVSRMMSSCGGTLFWGQGKFQLHVGYYSNPVKTFTLDDLRGEISLDTRVGARDNFNRVVGTFADIDVDYITSDFPPIESSAFLAEDNGVENTLDMQLPLTTSGSAAQRLAKMTLFRAREQMTLSAEFGLEAFSVQVGDVVAFTNVRYGWTAKEFEVVGWRFKASSEGGDLRINLTLRETSQAAFAWNAEESQIISNNTNLPSASDVPLPTLDAAVISTIVNEDGTAVPQILFRWSVSDITRVEYFDFQWKLSSQSVYQTAQVSGTEWTISPAISNSAYDYRVRAVSQIGYRSAFASSAGPASTGNDLTVPSAPTALVAEGGYSTAKLTWTPPTTNTDASTIRDLFQYQIFRGTAINPTVFVGRVSGESFTDGGLADDTTYYYRVKAQDFTGNLSAYSANQSVTTDVAPAGADGARGAGRWNIGVTSLPTTSSGANTDFVAAIGSPVDKDQAWFYTGTAANPTAQGVWLYDASTPVWIEQQEVIDGNLLVTETVTANAINADAITGKNVTVGNLTATTVPTGAGTGARIQSDGTMFVGNREEYLRWDGSLLTVNGEIRNIDQRAFDGRAGYWERVTSTGSVTAVMNRLGGAGLFVFIMCGGGGSGARGNTTARSQTGGGAGGFARVAYEWNGSQAVSFAAGSGGAGTGTGSTEIDGNNGSSSVLTVNGTTAITCTGGTKGLTHANGGAGGTGGTGTINDSSFFTNTRTSTGGAGGFTSDDYRQGTGGGGINVFQDNSSNDGGNITATGTGAAMGTAGGGPFGSGANNGNGASLYTGYLDADGFLSLAPTQSLFVTLRNSIPFTPSNGAYSGTGDARSLDAGEFSGSGAAVGGTTGDTGFSGDAGYGGGSGAAHSDGGENSASGSGGNGVLYIGRI